MFRIALFAVLATALAAGHVVSAEPKDKEDKVVTTKSGLKYIDVKVGDGDEAKKGKTVDVHYTGTLKDGKKFDSSVGRRRLRVPARRRQGHQGLGRRRRRHEGRRQAQADHPAGPRLRQQGRRRRDPRRRGAELRSGVVESEVVQPTQGKSALRRFPCDSSIALERLRWVKSEPKYD